MESSVNMIAVLLTSSVLLGLSSSSPVANFWLNHPSSLPPLNQYHTQDGSGAYRYGYTGPHHAKMETRSNGVTQGGYSYVDANGNLQTVAYTADAENGFRVRASNLPQPPTSDNSLGVSETPEVVAARRSHLENFSKAEAKLAEESSGQISGLPLQPSQQPTPNAFFSAFGKHAQVQRDTSANDAAPATRQQNSELENPFLLSGDEASRIEIPKPDPSLLKTAGNEDGSGKNEQSYAKYQNLDSSNVIPLPNVHRTLIHSPSTSYVVPVVPYRLLHSSLHHAQDSLGQYDYSYVGDTSSKTESRSLDGTTRGAYSYVDAYGLLQQVHYIADHNGFRVVATNLPEA